MPTCPLRYVDAGTWELIGLAELWEKGLPPVAGGVLDQTAFFVLFSQQVFAVAAPYKRKFEL